MVNAIGQGEYSLSGYPDTLFCLARNVESYQELFKLFFGKHKPS
jgi:hypothetical protein